MNKTLILVRFLVLLAAVALVNAARLDQLCADDSDMMTLMGRVLDENGKPVKGARVAANSSWESGHWVYDKFASSDKDGKFEYSMQVYKTFKDFTYTLWAVDADEACGAYFVVTLKSAEQPIEFTLKKLARVRATVLVEKSDQVAPWDPTWEVNLQEGAQGVAFIDCKESVLELKLPAGAYELSFACGHDEWKWPSVKFAVDDKATPVDLGEVKMELATIARLYGKAPPAITVSAVRNLPQDLEEKGDKITLGDFKGRWVLIEFWGFW